ncbi:hypothetical protein F4779DRAFT_572335 [Xylariaceae sp. FL0662B]|nr:hypothetical protein F4779DRAFT_572335 [Xylariaceae sp. FL0662B]
MSSNRGIKRTLVESDLELAGNALKYMQSTWSQASAPSSSRNGTAAADDLQSLIAKKLAAEPTAPKKKRKIPASTKLYKDTLRQVDKKFVQLSKKYKPNPTVGSGTTADDFAAAMTHFIPAVKKLRDDADAGDLPAAFNVALDLGEHAYGDLEACCKASGFGETEEPYQALDALLVELIGARQRVSDSHADSNSSPYELHPSASDFGDQEKTLRANLGARHPSKWQQRELEQARTADLNRMLRVRRDRRESAADWAGNALNDLVETRQRIDAYGIGQHFFRRSIELLCEMKGVEVPSLWSGF